MHDIASAGTLGIETERLATPGVSLEWHWNNDETMHAIALEVG